MKVGSVWKKKMHMENNENVKVRLWEKLVVVVEAATVTVGVEAETSWKGSYWFT